MLNGSLQFNILFARGSTEMIMVPWYNVHATADLGLAPSAPTVGDSDQMYTQGAHTREIAGVKTTNALCHLGFSANVNVGNKT